MRTCTCRERITSMELSATSSPRFPGRFKQRLESVSVSLSCFLSYQSGFGRNGRISNALETWQEHDRQNNFDIIYITNLVPPTLQLLVLMNNDSVRTYHSGKYKNRCTARPVMNACQVNGWNTPSPLPVNNTAIRKMNRKSINGESELHYS